MGRIMLVAALALAALLTAPAAGLAGGFATVGLSSLPEDVRPGEAWVVDLTVLQHGRTPLEGVEPAIVVEPVGRGTEIRFRARPTEEPGVYTARVVFPDAGEWRYSADDGFAEVHELGTTVVGGPAAAAVKTAGPEVADDGISVLAALGIAGAAGVFAAALAAPLGRRLSSKPA
jgi:hypothetical protein